MSAGLRVAIVGCGVIGQKWAAAAVASGDTVVGGTDVVAARATDLVAKHGGETCRTVDELLALEPDVVVVATVHSELADLTEAALAGGAHVLVEKPAGLATVEIDRARDAAARAGRLVKVGFNHRFHPGLSRLAAEVHSGEHGDLMFARGRYGHGGRVGYDREWRAQPALSGGGELIDQGMHLLDLTHWLAGPLPLHSALLRTQFWDTEVDDNAVLLLGDAASRTAPWAMLHVTWTEWKNMFSLEVYCRTAKLQVDGLAGSYGSQALRIYRMKPELGPPDLEEVVYPPQDVSWAREWEHFREAIEAGREPLGNLDDARYVWEQVERAYASDPSYAGMRAGIGG